jgi:iron complex transport system ATP-binding protein
MSLLSLKNVHFSYLNFRTGKPEFNISNINLDFEKGEFVSVLGPNGTGKSTLLKIIASSLKPNSGELFFNGKTYKQITRRDLASKIAFVPQATLSVFSYSVYEIVMMGRTPYLNFYGYESDTDRKIVKEALKIVDIFHLKDKNINEISGGEAQLAYIARAIAQQPEIILLDEPNAHLDIKHQISIFNLIKELNMNYNLMVISVSHDLNLAGYYSNRIILLKNGSIFKDDSPEKILTAENIRQVFEVDSTVGFNKELNSISVTLNPNLFK